MCGLCGAVRLGRLGTEAPPIERTEITRMNAAMALRGPDGEGLWLSEDGAVALGHRRLAILDLSDAGLQPMHSRDGRFHILLNGEIFNFRVLRSELERAGETFESASDTEVLLALWRRLGPAMLPRIRGMYALAIWDSSERSLFLARDPFGIKPLYVSTSGGIFRFASQVKALEASGAVPLDLDELAIAEFLLWGSVQEPRTIRRAIRAVPANSYLFVRDGRVDGPHPHPAGREDDSPPLPKSAVAALEDSVRHHLVSDVPVAIFLSGGLDSCVLAALARRLPPAGSEGLTEPPLTFTLTFDRLIGTPLDEGPLAAQVARALGMRHIERRMGRDDFLPLWDGALAAMDQPSIDGFNTLLVARAAQAQGIKVALSGLGGDELCGSYPSFRDVPKMAALARFPGARAFAAPFLRALGKRKEAAALASGGDLASAYAVRRALFLPNEIAELLGAEAARTAVEEVAPHEYARRVLANWPSGSPRDSWETVHRLESSLYLRNQLLRDADWASMACSLELRVPFVDPRLEAAFSAVGFEPARSGGKVALARAAAPELPAAVFARPKSGFYVPVAEWLDEKLTEKPRHLGDQSRALALRVLEAWGVEP